MSSQAPISLSGLASGLDTTSIVDALMQIERQPRVRLTTQQSQVQQRQSVLRDLEGRLNSLKLAADALRSPGLFADTQTISSSDTGKIDATRISGAGVGGTQITVSRLASSQQRTYSYTPNASSDTVMDFGNGTQLTITAGTDLDTLVTNINASSTSPVYAAAVTDPNDPSGTNKLLVLSSKTAGEGGDFSLQAGTTAGLVEDSRRAKTHSAFGAQQTFAYTADAVNPTTINVNGTDVTIEAGADAAAAATDINNAGLGVTASTDKYGHLVVTSNTTGTGSSLSVAGAQLALYSSSAGQNATTLKDLDAAYSVDGGPTQYSKSNVVTDAVPGIQLTLKAASADPVTITVGEPGPDHNAIKQDVKDFITQYNSVVDFINSKVKEQAVINPQTPADQLKGLFFGDPLLTGIQSRLRTAVMSPIGSDPTLNLLSQIGISTGATTGDGVVNQDSVAGKLTLDESKLDSMLDSNPLDVKALMGAATGVDGLGQVIDGVLDPEIGAGLDFDQQLSGMDSQLRDIADQMAAMDERLAATQERLKAQFTAMETALNSSQNQQQWLAGQIAGLPGG